MFYFSAHAQNTIYLFIDSVTIIGSINEGKVYTSESTIAYSVQGKIIYEGNIIDQKHIAYIVDVADFFSKKTGVVYQPDGKTVEYICQKSELFLGDYPINKLYERLLFMEKKSDSIIEVLHGIDEQKIGSIEGKNISTAELLAAAHLYIKHYQIDEDVSEIVAHKLDIEANQSPAGGTIRPLYGNNFYQEWSWDGNTLKPTYGYRNEDEWTFNGKYFQPVWGMDPQSEWVWENNILKPSWNKDSENEWIWDENVLKPFWDSNPDKMFLYEDGIVRPYWSFDQNAQWEVEGDLPLPVIAFVVLGIANR